MLQPNCLNGIGESIDSLFVNFPMTFGHYDGADIKFYWLWNVPGIAFRISSLDQLYGFWLTGNVWSKVATPSHRPFERWV